MPRLRTQVTALRGLAQRYDYSGVDPFELRPEVETRGCLTISDLRAVAKWKSPRSAGHIEKNSDLFVREITGIALAAREERTRVEVLRLLNGVGWPTASVILHFFHNDPYPIIDFRALYTVSMELPNQYTFDYWWQYVEFCRWLAEKSGLSMRELDQALWQYSKENQ
jgi:hypothetical protein